MNNTIRRFWNQYSMVNIEDLRGNAFQAEDGGHTFEITGLDASGNVVALSGTVAAVFLRADNTDVAISGTVSGGKVYVTLTDECYGYPGRFGLTIFLTSGGQKVAIYAAIGSVHRTTSGGVSPETQADVVDLINEIEAAIAQIPSSYTDIMAAVASTYSNTALYSVGRYVWYEGKLYRCVSDITTAESWTPAHWELACIGNDLFYTANSLNNKKTFSWIAGGWINLHTGVLVASDSYSHTDYIPVEYGQKIRIYVSIGGNAGPAFYDGNKQYISYEVSGDNNLKEYVLTVPENAKYMRLSCGNNDTSNDKTKVLYYENLYPTIEKALTNSVNSAIYFGGGRFEEIPCDRQYGVMSAAGSITENGDYRVICMVSPGDVYLVTGLQISNYFPLALLLDNDTVVESIDYGSAGTVSRYQVAIPGGVNKMVVNGTVTAVYRLSGENVVQSEGRWEVLPITPVSGIIATDGSTVSTGNHMEVGTQEGEHFRISGKKWSDYVPGYLVSDGSSIIASGQPDAEYFSDVEIVIPAGGRILYINGNAAIGLKCTKFSKVGYQNKTKQLSGKTMVWFGTSIPQNETYFDGSRWSIPSYAGKILGMNVINECVGASIAARGIYDQISASDPYGWTGVSWYAVFRSLGANLTEKQDLIDNYTSKWYALLGGSADPLYPGAKPQTLTDDLKAEIKACSYENKLMPYLDGTKPMPDLFVFEHGYNDSQATTFSGISPDETNLNRSLYSDAMYFFIKKIFEVNPQAKILIVSHYDNSSATGKKTFKAQQELAEYHGLYFCDVADNIGWTQRLVTTTGYWDSGVWVPSGGTSRTITRLAQCIPDQIHPHTDKSGSAVKREAQIIADFISSSVNLD